MENRVTKKVRKLWPLPMDSQIFLWFVDPLVEALSALDEVRQTNDEEGDHTTSYKKDNQRKSQAVLLKDRVFDYIIEKILPGGYNGRLHKLWKLYGNKAICIFISLAQVIMILVTMMSALHQKRGLSVAQSQYQYEDELWESEGFIAAYATRFACEMLARGLSICFQKYRRIGLTPLSLDWQPSNLIDLVVMSLMQIGAGSTIVTFSLNFSFTAIGVYIPPILNGAMILIGLYSFGWTFLNRNELTNEGTALVKSTAITRLMAFSWGICSVSSDIFYVTFASAYGTGGRVGFLLFLELCSITWELSMEFRDAKLTYICGKVLIPIRRLEIFESFNTYQAEALRSNDRIDGVIAVTSRSLWQPTGQTVDAIQKLVPILGGNGPLAGGEWLSHLGGHSRNAVLQVKLAILPMFDSERIVMQDDRLYVLTSPSKSTLQSGLVIEKDGTSQRLDNIVLNPDKCAWWQGVRIIN